MKWQPKGQKKRARPKLSLVDGIQSMVVQKGLTDWKDRDN